MIFLKKETFIYESLIHQTKTKGSLINLIWMSCVLSSSSLYLFSMLNWILFYSPCVLESSVIMFKNSTQNFNISDALYTIPVIRTQGLENPSTVNWRTISSRFNLSGPVKFAPGEMEKNIVIDTRTQQMLPKESFQLELFDPSANSLIRDRKTTLVNITDSRGEKFSLEKSETSGFSFYIFSLMDEMNTVWGGAHDWLHLLLIIYPCSCFLLQEIFYLRQDLFQLKPRLPLDEFLLQLTLKLQLQAPKKSTLTGTLSLEPKDIRYTHIYMYCMCKGVYYHLLSVTVIGDKVLTVL